MPPPNKSNDGTFTILSSRGSSINFTFYFMCVVRLFPVIFRWLADWAAGSHLCFCLGGNNISEQWQQQYFDPPIELCLNAVQLAAFWLNVVKQKPAGSRCYVFWWGDYVDDCRMVWLSSVVVWPIKAYFRWWKLSDSLESVSLLRFDQCGKSGTCASLPRLDRL